MTDGSYVYEDIAERIGLLIEEGTLRPGDKAPSLRKLSAKLGVSVTSVMRAYTALEGQGLLESQPQSGFYVRARRARTRRVVRSRPSLAEIPVAKNQLIASFLDTIQEPRNRLFGCASPDVSLLPGKQMSSMLAWLARNEPELNDYVFPPGDVSLRRQIARSSLNFRCQLSPEDIVITTGGLNALNLCLNATAKPGDAIAIESPTYFGVLQAIENQNMRAVEIPTCPETGVDLDALEAAMKQGVKACLFIPNFNNPIGSLMPDSAKRHMADLCARWQIPLIEDDIYGDIYFGPERPRPVKAFDRDGWVMLCSSFSKTLSPGLRVGHAASERYAARLRELQFMTTLAAPSLSQRSVAKFLESGRYDRCVRKFRKTLHPLLNRYSDAICASFPAGSRITAPKGGFVLWIALPPQVDTLKLYERAIAEHISFAPGALFTARQAFRNCLRLNCAIPWSGRVEASLQRLGELAKDMASGR